MTHLSFIAHRSNTNAFCSLAFFFLQHNQSFTISSLIRCVALMISICTNLSDFYLLSLVQVVGIADAQLTYFSRNQPSITSSNENSFYPAGYPPICSCYASVSLTYNSLLKLLLLGLFHQTAASVFHSLLCHLLFGIIIGAWLSHWAMHQ